MTTKQSAKYFMAIAIGFSLGSATNLLLPSSEPVYTAQTAQNDQIVLLRWQQASMTADLVRQSLRNDGFDVVIGSDDSLNAVLILADQPTTELAKHRIQEFDNISLAQSYATRIRAQ